MGQLFGEIMTKGMKGSLSYRSTISFEYYPKLSSFN